jgi:hypothetical protein
MKSPEADDTPVTQAETPTEVGNANHSAKKVSSKRNWGRELFIRSSDLWLNFSTADGVVDLIEDAESPQKASLDVADESLRVGSNDPNIVLENGQDSLEIPDLPPITQDFTSDVASDTDYKKVELKHAEAPEADDTPVTQAETPTEVGNANHSAKKVSSRRNWGRELFVRSSDLWLNFADGVVDLVEDAKSPQKASLDVADESLRVGSNDPNIVLENGQDSLEIPALPPITQDFTFDVASDTDYNKVDLEHLEDPTSPHNMTFETEDTYDDDSRRVSENEGYKRLPLKHRRYINILVVCSWLTILAVVIFVFWAVFRKEKFEQIGYPYTKDLTSGWLFDASLETGASSFSYYDSIDLVPNGKATEIDCARKCKSENAFAGAWNTFYMECWCYFDVPGDTNYCFEPCVIESGIEFSIRPYDAFNYCDESYCQIFDASEYCKFRKFNPDLCLEP